MEREEDENEEIESRGNGLCEGKGRRMICGRGCVKWEGLRGGASRGKLAGLTVTNGGDPFWRYNIYFFVRCWLLLGLYDFRDQSHPLVRFYLNECRLGIETRAEEVGAIKIGLVEHRVLRNHVSLLTDTSAVIRGDYVL